MSKHQVFLLLLLSEEFYFDENRKKFVSDVMSVTQPVGGAFGLCLTH